MKKKNVIFGLLIFLVVISFVNFASAGLFSDFWSKITGHIVEEDCSNSFDDDNDTLVDCDDPDCAYTVDCVLCYDSDGGIDYNVKGEARGIGAGVVSTHHREWNEDGTGGTVEGPGVSNYWDICISNGIQVNEAFCAADGRMSITSTNCQYGCDAELDICYCGKDERSTCEYGCNIELNTCNSAPEEQCDSSHLNLCVEANCTSAGGYWNGSTCNSEAQGTCTDSDGGLNYLVKGTTSNLSITYTDYCNDGNYLVEYSCNGFSIANDWINCNDFLIGSTCSNGRCGNLSNETTPTNQTFTDNETTTNQTTPSQTTSATPDLEQPIPEQPIIPTANQTIPIPEQTITAEQIETIHEINEMNILGNEISCPQGCFYKGKCLPMGIRKKINKINVYCNTTSMWDIQKGEDWSCDNHYECRSNFCVDDQCIKQGFLMKIINWFKRLFGVFGVDEEELNQTSVEDNETIPVDNGTITNQTIPINETTSINGTAGSNQNQTNTNQTTNQTS